MNTEQARFYHTQLVYLNWQRIDLDTFEHSSGLTKSVVVPWNPLHAMTSLGESYSL